MEINHKNQFAVIIVNNKIAITQPNKFLTPDEAINLAAWLRTIAECVTQNGHEVETKYQYILGMVKEKNVKGVARVFKQHRKLKLAKDVK